MNALCRNISAIGLSSLLAAGPALGAEPRDFSAPFDSLRRSNTPLNTAERLLEAGEKEAVAKYYEALLEDGKLEAANRMRCVQEMYAGNYSGAVQALELVGSKDAWAVSRANYLQGLLSIQGAFAENRSDHFLLRTPSDDVFLAQYALPALEAAYAKLAAFYGELPAGPIVVEVYPTPETFSYASTLPPEAIERSGAIGICKFGRLMILSPQATPMGYRWLDALVHELVHLAVNKLSRANAPLWLHEGTARYWESVWRRPAGFALSPADAALLASAVQAEAAGQPALVSFDRMEPSFVNLPDQRTAALAYAQTADAVDYLGEEFGAEKNKNLLTAFASMPRDDAFKRVLDLSEADFEKSWRESLSKSTVPVTSGGAMAQTIQLKGVDEVGLAGVDAQGHIRLGDRLRQQGQNAAALAQYKKAADLEPRNGVVLARLARAQVAAGRYTQAEQTLRTAMESNPSYAAPFVMLGDLLFEDGRYEEAQAVLQGALEINPFHPKIHEVLGLIAVDLGQFPQARLSLNLALRFDKNNDAVREALNGIPKNR